MEKHERERIERLRRELPRLQLPHEGEGRLTDEEKVIGFCVVALLGLAVALGVIFRVIG